MRHVDTQLYICQIKICMCAIRICVCKSSKSDNALGVFPLTTALKLLFKETVLQYTKYKSGTVFM